MAKKLGDTVNGDRLLDLAADRSRAAKTELTNAIVDLFLPERHRLSDHQRAMLTDVLRKLIGSLEIEVRQYLGEALLRGPDPLPELQSVHANDEIEVAQAVMERRDRKRTRLNSSHSCAPRMPSTACKYYSQH